MRNLPDDVNDSMIDRAFGGAEYEPVFPIYVDMYVGGEWECWAQVDSIEDAQEELEILDDHGFQFQVYDSNDHRFDLTPRKG